MNNLCVGFVQALVSLIKAHISHYKGSSVLELREKPEILAPKNANGTPFIMNEHLLVLVGGFYVFVYSVLSRQILLLISSRMLVE